MSRRPDRPGRRRARRAAATMVCALVAWAASSAWSGAAADAPVKYGWWWAANAGAAAPPPPPDVPAKGLYVENGFSGPTAIAAVSFAVPRGAAVGALTLETAGKPIISAPPVACAITAAGRDYRPAENGPWTGRPAYDCGAGQAKGAVSADGKQVAFPVAPLVRGGTLDVVILAAGRTDRIPFQPPDVGALAVTRAVTPGRASRASPALGGAYGGQPSTTGTAAVPHPGAVPAAPVPPSTDGAAAMNPLPDTALAPTVAPPSGQAGRPPASPVTARDASFGGGAGTRMNVATAFGLVGMVAALLFWTEGFGLLGGRVTTLAGRRRGRVRTDEPPTAAPSVAAP